MFEVDNGDGTFDTYNSTLVESINIENDETSFTINTMSGNTFRYDWDTREKAIEKMKDAVRAWKNSIAA